MSTYVILDIEATSPAGKCEEYMLKAGWQQ